MPIDDRNLTAGTQLVGSYKKETYACSVERSEDGKLAYVLADGRRYKSPSSSAGAVMGGKSVNGWLFWSLVSETTPRIEASVLKADSSPTKKVIYRQPNQRGVEAGSVRYWCNACMKGFIVADGDNCTCPEGHESESEAH
jgi:hypothetical protein